MPFYASGTGWHPTTVLPAGDLVAVPRVDFAAGPVDELVAGEAEVALDHTLEVNAVRLAGRVGLSAERTLGPTHAVNGDKILPIARWLYRMGAGLGALSSSVSRQPQGPGTVAYRTADSLDDRHDGTSMRPTWLDRG
jgi:hypothetical protein